MRRIPPLLALLAATLLFMSVAFVDGRPTVFTDSHSYDVMGRDLIETVRDWPASNQNKYEAAIKRGLPPEQAKAKGNWPVPIDRLTDPSVEGGRSPFYGVLLHATYLFTTIWGLAALQSLLAAWVVYLLWRTLAPKAPGWSYLAVIAAATIGSSVSFYTTFAMPDIFAAIGGAAVVLILSQSDRLKKLEIAALWVLVAYSMAIHKSHWATGLVVAVGGGGLLWLMGLATRTVVRRVLLVISAAAVAWAAGAAFAQVYENRLGHKLNNPPFMMARVLADGPGQAYMLKVCPKSGPVAADPYVVCRFKANVGHSIHATKDAALQTNLILWSDRKRLGVFNLGNWAEREGLEAEEMRFVLNAVKSDPVGQLGASLWDWAQELVAYQVDDPLRDPAFYLRGRYWPTTILPKLIPNFEACRPPRSCKPPFNDTVLDVWQGAVLIASLLLLAWRLSLKDVREAVSARGLKQGEETARALASVLLLVALVVVNAAVCGILSGPFARYQSRVIWLIPIGAGLVACALPMTVERLRLAGRGAWGWTVGLWERVRALPAIGRFLPPLDGPFTRFCCVGLLGFTVDFGTLTAVVDLGVNKIGGKVISFSVAVVGTWMVNRLWTFRAHEGPRRSLAREFGSYLTVQSVGFAANFAAYTATIYAVPVRDEHLQLLLGSVAGTAAGLVINYLGAKHLVFRRGARPS